MITETAVFQTVTVSATPKRAFQVFTQELDTWWPRGHHIGKSPMKKAVMQSGVGGRVYFEQADGSDCDWGEILAWDPPHRFVMAWKITAEWQPEPSLAKSSEVEVTFTELSGGSTRVELEHRFFDRHGAGGEDMRSKVDSPEGGWGKLLQIFAEVVER